MIYFFIKYNLIRAFLFFILFDKRGYGAEIGVWKGLGAKMIYSLTRPKQLHLIDPYLEKKCDDVYAKRPSQDEMDKIYEKVKKWSENKYITLHRDTSQNVAKKIDELKHWLDFVYIDGDHFDVYNDLTYWYDNVKPNGIIMGDDYGVKGYPQIKKDVDRFCKERNIKLHHIHFQFWFRV